MLSDGFCKPTTKTPYTLTWFDEKFCLIFQLQEFIGRMTRIKDRYWIETDTFIETSNITQKLQSHKNYNIQSSFSLFDDSNYQNTIERIQTPFRVKKLNTWHIGTFVFDENYPDWIVNVTQNTYSRCRSDREHLITRQSWKLRIVNTATDYDDKNNQLTHDGHILPCFQTDFVNQRPKLHIH